MRRSIVVNLITATVFTIVGLIAGPFVGGMLNDYISITPSRLVKLLESGDVQEFNDLRAQLKQPISFEAMRQGKGHQKD